MTSSSFEKDAREFGRRLLCGMVRGCFLQVPVLGTKQLEATLLRDELCKVFLVIVGAPVSALAPLRAKATSSFAHFAQFHLHFCMLACFTEAVHTSSGWPPGHDLLA